MSIERTKEFGPNQYGITCPACAMGHMLKGWTFNGNLERPTFTPSLLVTGQLRFPTDEELERITTGEKVDIPDGICHSYITDGNIQYLTDCTHAFAGKTLELPTYGDYDSPAKVISG
jgi:hypothetical protein